MNKLYMLCISDIIILISKKQKNYTFESMRIYENNFEKTISGQNG